jgi:transposase-like protein
MRKHHRAAFKARIVVETLRETKTRAQIAAENQLHPTPVSKCKHRATRGL